MNDLVPELPALMSGDASARLAWTFSYPRPSAYVCVCGRFVHGSERGACAALVVCAPSSEGACRRRRAEFVHFGCRLADWCVVASSSGSMHLSLVLSAASWRFLVVCVALICRGRTTYASVCLCVCVCARVRGAMACVSAVCRGHRHPEGDDHAVSHFILEMILG